MGYRHVGDNSFIVPFLAKQRNAIKLVPNRSQRACGAMLRRIPVFQQGALCLTKFGTESGGQGNPSAKGLGTAIGRWRS
jgi:hypothetical protein